MALERLPWNRVKRRSGNALWNSLEVQILHKLLFSLSLFLIEKAAAGRVCINCCRPWVFSFVAVAVLLGRATWGEPLSPLARYVLRDAPFVGLPTVSILGVMSFAQLDQRLQKGMDYTYWFNALSPDPRVVPNAKLTVPGLLHSPLWWLALWINSAQPTTRRDFLDNNLSILLGWRDALNAQRESKRGKLPVK